MRTQFRARQATVEAIRYVNMWDVLRWVEKVAKGSVSFYCHDDIIELPSEAGNLIAQRGDYIVFDEGLFFPLSRYLFELIYEPKE